MLSFKHILVPIDFSGPSKRALKLATELAIKFGSSLTLVHVCEIPTYAGMAASLPDLISSLEQSAARALEQIVEPVRRKLPSTTSVIRTGVAWEEILEVSREAKSDLIIVGTHGRTGFARAWLGSVAEKLVRLVSVPVLTIREGEQPSEREHVDRYRTQEKAHTVPIPAPHR